MTDSSAVSTWASRKTLKTVGAWRIIQEDFPQGHAHKADGRPVVWSCAPVKKRIYYAGEFSCELVCIAHGAHWLASRTATVVDIDGELRPLSLKAGSPLTISSVCTSFAPSEVVRSLREGVSRPDIAAGICEATAERVVTLLKRVGVEPDWSFREALA